MYPVTLSLQLNILLQCTANTICDALRDSYYAALCNILPYCNMLHHALCSYTVPVPMFPDH